ncbi:MAG: hypothetical protein KJP07_07965, partial [Desulfatitalea sp.]|nr:hypothetical protein [Desulfatitalea sp.]
MGGDETMMALFSHISGFPLRMRTMRVAVLACAWLVLPLVSAANAAAAEGVREIDHGAAAEMHLPGDRTMTPWRHDPDRGKARQGDIQPNQAEGDPEAATEKQDKRPHRIKVCRSETVCKLRYQADHVHRAQVKHLIAPLCYDRDALKVSDAFVARIRQAMANLDSKRNLVIHFTAHMDSAALNDREARIYGDAFGFSKAVARRVSQVVQEALVLPDDAVMSEGRGATRPVADNQTEQGRALNRRVAVSFWYDDALQDLPDEPQLCPDTDAVETVVRTYEAAPGGIPPILFKKGKPVIPPGYT